METIDYSTRADLVAAVLDFRKRGVQVEVVNNGKTLKFPDGIGALPEDEMPTPDDDTLLVPPANPDESLLGVVQPEVEQPPAETTSEEPDHSTFTIEGICSKCGEAALAEEDGSWVHAGASSHGDDEGEFVPNEPANQIEQPVVAETPAEDDVVEDLIGTPAPQASKSKRKSTRGK